MNLKEPLLFVVGKNDDGKRVDRLVREVLPTLPLSAVFKLLRTGAVRLNDSRIRHGQRACSGDRITVAAGRAVAVPDSTQRGSPRVGLSMPRGNDLSRFIIAETADIVFVNKPRGMLSHGPGGLDEAAAAYFEPRLPPSLAFRPAPLHRLDRNSSGIVAISASIAGARAFSDALRNGHIDKWYIAMLSGEMRTTSRWEHTLIRDVATHRTGRGGVDGYRAETVVEPLAWSAGLTVAIVRIFSGFTHQIRAQAALAGYPLAFDRKYGGQEASTFSDSYILHAIRLGLPDLSLWNPPVSAPRTVVAPPPEEACATIETIFGPEIVKKLESVDFFA